MFGLFTARRRQEAAAAALYASALTQARHPAFYGAHGVPDSFDGRYELVILHVFLVLRRLKQAGETGGRVGQALFELMLADFDQALREIGVGDMGVPHHIKRMAEGYNGRVHAYDAALADADDRALMAALRRNVYGTQPTIAEAVLAEIARYVRAADRQLLGAESAVLIDGRVTFPPPPASEAASAQPLASAAHVA